MDRFPGLREVIGREFGSIGRLASEAEIPDSTIKHLLLGYLNPRAEANAIERVDDALRRLRPEANFSGLWNRQEPATANNIVMKIPPGAKVLRINLGSIDVKFE